MVQDQLVEYISSQLKTGVAAEAIRTALLSAGWQQQDVDDTMKKVQAPSAADISAPAQQPRPIQVQPQVQAQPQAQPMAAQSRPAASFTPSSPDPRVIRVSDLVTDTASSGGTVSSTNPSGKSMATSGVKPDAVITKIAATPSKTGAVMPQAVVTTSGGSGKSHAGTIEMILGILMLGFGGVAVFLFLANQNLSSQINGLKGQSTGVSSQMTQLQNQLQASTTDLMAQLAAANQTNQDLARDLSFYAAAPGVQATTTQVALSGTVSGGGKYLYTIATANGAKIPVANSRDARVIALIQPLVGVSTPAPFAGTYVPGTDIITLTSVNGTAVASASAGTPIANSSSTPSSTAGQ